jgi:hypothetical protein
MKRCYIWEIQIYSSEIDARPRSNAKLLQSVRYTRLSQWSIIFPRIVVNNSLRNNRLPNETEPIETIN